MTAKFFRYPNTLKYYPNRPNSTIYPNLTGIMGWDNIIGCWCKDFF